MPPLLHSMATFGGVLHACLDAASADRVVEVGAEGGDLSALLADRAERRNGGVVCVDPRPSDRLLALARERESVTLLEDVSPPALERAGAFDAVVLDGDHNYATVLAELRKLRDSILREQGPVLVLLHDVGWPCARRDMYYAPDRIEDHDRQPFTYQGGVRPGVSELVPKGFRGQGTFAWARHEGGERNGVLTAVEDFLSETDGLRFHLVPAVFGLGVLYAERAPWATAVAAAAGPFDRLDLLETLERNRVELYLHVMDLQDRLDERAAAHARVVRDLQAQIAALRGRS